MERGAMPGPPPVHWDAAIALGFTRVGGGTLLAERRHSGPLRVQKALYPEGPAVCQTILLHPPSGIAGGDRLRVAVAAGPGTHAQITTPGAGKWYRSGGEEASQALDFTVGDDAILEWLPQETIVFDGARSRMETHVRLGNGSRYLGWEILCLGRSACGERFAHGQIRLHTRIERHGRPLWLERGCLDGDDPLLASPAGWAGASVGGTLLATFPPHMEIAPVLAACRAIAPADGAEHGVTALPELLIARYLGHSSEAARDWFAEMWSLLRPPLLGRPAVRPRIWNT
ncbi:urease accessory protein UreD [Propionivibrio sp.]|uniref:urease accessory protein UreD n=1 Tax=Propionivibrio sp. TaxID=2212460 RepID=UPI0039E6F33F